MQQAGHKVNVIAPGHSKAASRESFRGIDVLRFSYCFPKSLQKVAYGDGIPTNLRKSIFAKMQLPLFLFFFFLKAWKQSKKADIIHCHWTLAGLIGVLVGKMTGKPVVMSMHGAEIFVLGKNRILNYVLKNTKVLINNSNFTQKEVLRHYPGTRCTVISPGTNINRFKVSRDNTLRQKLGIPENDLFVLSIGKFIPRKGFEYLIKAMDVLINEKKLSHIQLRIGGRGYLKESYLNLIDQFILHTNIQFLDYIPDDKIPYYFTEADVFVLPSIVDENGDTEGLGVVLIEANACETPVIATSVGGITDVVLDGINGFLVEEKNAEELAEKIAILDKEEEKRKSMGISGRKMVEEKFSWKTNADKMIEEYYKILSEK